MQLAAIGYLEMAGLTFGIDKLEWDELVDAAMQILIEVAAAGSTTTYGDLSQRLRHRPPHKDIPAHQGPMPHLLEAVSLRVRQQDPDAPLLSALVHRADKNLPGQGFFTLAAREGFAVGDRMEFWAAYVHAVHEWARARRHPRRRRPGA